MAAGQIENLRRLAGPGKFFRRSASDRRTRRQRLDAAQLAASTARAVIVDCVVTAFRGGAGAAMINAAIENNPGSNAGTDGGAENIAKAASRTP